MMGTKKPPTNYQNAFLGRGEKRGKKPEIDEKLLNRLQTSAEKK